MGPDEVVRAEARPARTPLVPEVVVPTAGDVVALWERTEARAGAPQPPPFWGYPWPGGQALARHVLDVPGTVAGRRVVDVACGSGLVAAAAALAGAASVRAVDLDPLAAAAARWTADLNDVVVEVVVGDALADDAAEPGHPLFGAQVVLVGDLFYERPTARRLLPVLLALRAAGVDVLVGDPGRAHLPVGAFEEVARYDVPVVADLEDRDVRSTAVLRPRPAAPGPLSPPARP